MLEEKTLIIIPTFNEAENIADLYHQIRKHGVDKEVLFVDDNSQDGTREIIEDIIKKDSGVHLLKRRSKKGIARAYLAGFNWGLSRDYDWFQQMDADFSHHPDYLASFDALKKENQVIVASRYIKRGKVEKWDLFRKLVSLLGCYYLKLILGLRLDDLTGGFNCWHRDVLLGIDLDKVVSHGYLFQAELKFMAAKRGFKITEFPYVFKEREKGKSKINYRIILEGLLRPLLIRFKYRF